MTAAASMALNRPVSPWREMGAYEALWMESKAWFKSIAEKFASHPGSVPTDFFAMQADVPKEYAEKANTLLEKGGVKRYGLRINGAGDYPARLRDAQYPIELLYYQGHWDLVETRCVAVVGARNASPEGQK